MIPPASLPAFVRAAGGPVNPGVGLIELTLTNAGKYDNIFKYVFGSTVPAHAVTAPIGYTSAVSILRICHLD
ncbi:hypothetical protein GCM10010912_54100 [Paenibacillus albidus]|uniref:Uncharacterized protein n=1 Tax=Paenibacillus albidus TaxID=2041023 RepID=A0A917D006_9BACL|nr:hypothetical protein GCM10010912_54100 [Paenibacillus albidus]